ncbi:hypothetical protein GF351_05825 [Candidatus Woesearchaeota archaeon]|nr:hypothetical protein [Candidatus Woesearchaeota archaeon]
MYLTNKMEKMFELMQFSNSHEPRGFIVPRGEAVAVFRPKPVDMETWRHDPMNWSIAVLPKDPEERQASIDAIARSTQKTPDIVYAEDDVRTVLPAERGLDIYSGCPAVGDDRFPLIRPDFWFARYGAYKFDCVRGKPSKGLLQKLSGYYHQLNRKR